MVNLSKTCVVVIEQLFYFSSVSGETLPDISPTLRVFR